MKTAKQFYTERNGGKSPEQSLKDGEYISPILACLLMSEYASEYFIGNKTEIKEHIIDIRKLLIEYDHFMSKYDFGDKLLTPEQAVKEFLKYKSKSKKKLKKRDDIPWHKLIMTKLD